jgi:hypothetical protein
MAGSPAGQPPLGCSSCPPEREARIIVEFRQDKTERAAHAGKQDVRSISASRLTRLAPFTVQSTNANGISALTGATKKV